MCINANLLSTVTPYLKPELLYFGELDKSNCFTSSNVDGKQPTSFRFN